MRVVVAAKDSALGRAADLSLDAGWSDTQSANQLIRRRMVEALERTGGSLSRTAKLLDVHLNTVRYRLEKLSLFEFAAELRKRMLYSTGIALAVGDTATVNPAAVGAPPGVGFQEWDTAGNQLQPKGPLQYHSDAPTVATVDASGNVRAVSAGSAHIIATDLGSGLTASTQVQVAA